MIVGVDGRVANEDHPAGVGHYCRALLPALDALDVDLRVYLDAPPRAGFPALDGEIRVLPSGKFWTHRALSHELHRHPPDVYFTPVPQLPWRCPCPSLVSALDLGAWRHPECFPWRKRMAMALKTRHALRRAHHVIAISQSTADDLVHYTNMDPTKITVIPLGLSPVYAASGGNNLSRPDGLPARYIVYVGQIQPRKNLVRLVEAFGQLCQRHPELPHDLVIAGPDGWQALSSHAAVAASPVARRIHRLGYIPESQMAGLVAGADVLALVSLWEGFGLPALEAMAMGTAVLGSNCGALPEVVGNSGVLVDPEDVGAIAMGLERLLQNDPLREECEAKGRQRAQEFRWEEGAKKIIDAAHALMT